jgi:FkbM family methyltransferase
VTRAAARRLVRRVAERPAVERRVALFKRSSVLAGADRARFLARETARRRTIGRYRVRGVPGVVLLRHRTPDVVTLDEVFYSRDYELPAEVDALLAARPAPLEAVDLGANAGYFGAFLRGRFPGLRVTAVEPDPGNARLVRETIAANALSWRVVEACAATHDGTLRFAAGRYSLSRVLGPDEDEAGALTLPAVDVLPMLDGADVVKIDIEGAEWPILEDERFAATSARAVVLEYHPAPGLAASPHEAAEGLLGRAGFALHSVWRRDDGHGVIWGWKTS